MEDREPIVAIVLAAGDASRFGSPKALASLAGKPLLQHVLDRLDEAGVAEIIVVLGSAADAVEEAIAWRGERRVRNPSPERGLASSLQVGLAALPPGTAAALIVLGDQPWLRPAVVGAVLDAWCSSDRPIVVPRYDSDGALNPVLIGRSVFPLALALDGDRGMGPLIHSSPELVTDVAVGGDNPDVDTPADLERLQLEAAWGARVRANREQVDRVREVADERDFYRPTSSMFIADPFRTDDAVLDALVALTRPGETWLDIGSGAGRFALPIARRVAEVVAIEPSEGMRAGLRDGMATSGIANVRIIDGRWPTDAGSLRGDVALIAHVGYDVEAIGPFLDAMERASGRLCVAVLMAMQPAAIANRFWPPIHGEERVSLPALDEFVALLRSRGRTPSVAVIAGQPRRWSDVDEAEAFMRQQLWVDPDGQKGRRLEALLRALPREATGEIRLDSPNRDIGIVTWAR